MNEAIVNEAIKRRLVGGGVLVVFGLLVPMSLVWWARPSGLPEDESVRVYEITDTGDAIPMAEDAQVLHPAAPASGSDRAVARASTAGERALQIADAQPMPQPAVPAAPEDDPKPVSVADGDWVIQVGSFTREGNALAMARELTEEYPAYTHKGHIDGTLYYRVRIGPYGSSADAEAVAAALRRAGHNTQVQRRKPDSA